MSDPAGTLLSVRGEARQVVPPDSVTMTARVEVTRGSKAEAAGGGESDPPSLDPVPQELTAVIEARLVAGGVSLTGGAG